MRWFAVIYNMIQPKLLREGDKVALVATARKVSPQEMEPAIELLRSWGLQPVVPEGLYAEHHQMAGTDEHRSAVLQQLLDDPHISAIWCARGGYGTARIIDSLDYTCLAAHPKWIIGYSDVTALHSDLLTHAACQTLHATMPINISAVTMHSPAVHTLHDILFGTANMQYSFELKPTDPPYNRKGRAAAVVVGGNLSVLYSQIATPSDLDTDGKILLIEDLDEYLYHIDRMMQALRRSGKLSGLAGLIVGQFTDLHDNAIPFGSTFQQIVLDAVEGYDYPVCFNAPFGHTGADNWALPLGREVHLSVTPRSAEIMF